jgi:hypothetical protein
VDQAKGHSKPQWEEKINGEEKEGKQETKGDVLETVHPMTEKVTEEAPEPEKRRIDRETLKEKPLAPEHERIAESRKALLTPLAPGQQFYESPEGYIVVAEEGKGSVWCRQANHGKGMHINPRR